MTGLGMLTLQRRMRELGRIRLGEKGVAKNGKTFPKKLSGFRLTSASEQTLIVAASLYGGEVRRWEGAPGEGKQWELYIGDRIDVLLPPGESLSQSFEMWSGGGCVRRCNGIAMDDGEVCQCPSDIEDKMAAAAKGEACKPTSRLGLILPRLPDIGVWRMESHGYNAAVELPGTVEVLKALAGAGHMVPAFLRIDQRTSVKDGQTRHFIVPVLELPSVTIAELQAGTSPVQIGSAPVVALSDPGPQAALPGPAPEGPTVKPPAATKPALPGETPADVGFIASLKQRLDAIEPQGRRVECKKKFADRFGHPDHLTAGQAHPAEAWVASLAPEPADDGAPFDDAAPAEPKKSRSLTTPQKLHIHATKDCGMSEDDLDVVILNNTLGATSSAKDLAEADMARVWQACDDVRDGRLDMKAVRVAVEEWKVKQTAVTP